MSSRNLIAIAMLALAMLVGGGAMVVHAIPGRAAPGDGDNIAVVDMERLYSNSDLPQVLAAKANQLSAQVQERLDTIADAKFLDAKELQEYVELVVKLTPDAAQQARMKELKTLSSQRSSELDTLNVKPADMVTAADKTRQRSLVEMSHLVDKVLPGIRDDMMTDEADRVRAIRRDQISQLRTIVGQVAKEKGVVHVFDVNALVYSANDLTPLVLKKLKTRQIARWQPGNRGGVPRKSRESVSTTGSPVFIDRLLRSLLASAAPNRLLEALHSGRPLVSKRMTSLRSLLS